MSADGTAAADTQPAVDPQHPWLGLASFTEESRGYFHGREEEVAELSRRVQRKLLTVLFGQSGLGKTSILRAGIVPRLRPEGYCPVYVRIDYAPESPPPTEQIKQAIFRATESMGTWTQAGTAVEGESLWEFLHHRDDILRDASGRTVVPLLIFDQFEEIFTLAQADDVGRRRAAQFIEDLADLVENRPPKAVEARLETDDTVTERFDFGRADYRILIALREDYLAHLESVKGAMPSITQNRMRLARMNGQQALAAVMKPGGKLVSQEVAESIVRFIAGGSELPNAEVEPSLLSLICRELNNARIAQGRAEISADLLAGSHDTILAEFYERALADQPEAVRKVIEDMLLTESGYRESLAEERLLKAFATAGAAPDALATLVNRRLLRIEERLDVRRVELTHDVLCGVVKTSRERRLEREAKEEAERQLATQKAREEATRKALVRARQIAAGCAVLAVGAIVSAVFGYFNMNRAREAEANAQSARGQAEKLIVYLLDDFHRELEPIGRLDIVSGLAQRALDYYRDLPAALRTPDTERNRALALTRYGAVLRRQASLDKAKAALAEAIEIFKRLQAQGDNSEATILGLAGALSYQSRVSSLERDDEAMKRLGDAALETLKPLASSPKPSVAVLRLYGDILESTGFRNANVDPAQGVKDLQQAREIYLKLGAKDLTDIAAAASYASSGYWLGLALQRTEKPGEARLTFEETLAMANRVLEVMPGNTIALFAKGNVSARLSQYESADLRPAKALAFLLEGQKTWEGLLKIAPTNAVYQNNYAVTRNDLAWALWSMGRLDESRDVRRATVEAGERAAVTSPFAARNLLFWSGILAATEAELGDPVAADVSLARAERFNQAQLRGSPASFDRALVAEYLEFAKVRVRAESGDIKDAAKRGGAVLTRLEAMAPKNKGDEVQKENWRYRVAVDVADYEYRAGNYAGSQSAANKALDAWKKLPAEDGRIDYERRGTEAKVLIARAVARQGRVDEAAAMMAPALDFHRKLHARGHEDRMQHFEFANALLVAAISAKGQKQALLAEASAILRTLPPVMNGWGPNVRLRAEIAEEQKRR